jgi:hypothetical protein
VHTKLQAPDVFNHLQQQSKEEKIKLGGAVANETTFNRMGKHLNLDLNLRLRRSPGSARSSLW